MAQLFRADDQLFKQLGIDKQLIKISYELTKPAIVTVSFNLKTTEKTYTDLSEAEAVKLLAAAMEKKQFESIDLINHAASTNKAYFPSQNTLQKFGVKGIVNYPYPKNKKEMDGMLRDAFQEQIELVGDSN